MRLTGLLRGWPPLFAETAFIVTVGLLPAQARVSLESSGKPNELELQVRKLGQDSTRPAAMASLFAAGRPAVPLLAHAARRDDALSLPALRVLEELRGSARAAAPVLASLAKGSTPLARAAAHTLAAIGERDTVIFSDWGGNRVVETDALGKVLREVKVHHPWCVQVLADDHLLVCCVNDNKLCVIDWQGKELSTVDCQHPMWARRLVDGSTWISEGNRVVRLSGTGQTLSEAGVGARMFQVTWNDGLLALDPESAKLFEVDGKGAVVREIVLGHRPMAFDIAPSGRIHVLYQDRLTEVDNSGKEHAVRVAEGYAGYALVCQRDGTRVFGEGDKLTLRTATGEVTWKASCNVAPCVVPRIDLPDPR